MKLSNIKNIVMQFTVYLSFVLICNCQQLDSLIDLQKAYLFAETKEDSLEIINDLEEYYLNLDVPDSIRQHVEDEVQTLIDTSNINSIKYSEKILKESNIYVLENNLKDLIKDIMICKTRNDVRVLQKLMYHADKIADAVDKGKESDYWISFINRVKQFSKERALSWLKADCSAYYSSKYYDSDLTWKKGEYYAALGLQYNYLSSDMHIYFDLLQRLQVLLYQYYAYYDLSFGIAESSLPKLNSIKYPLRKCGILFNLGNAYLLSGYSKIALNHFIKVKRIAIDNKNVPSIIWYRNAINERIALTYQKMGQFTKGIAICDSAISQNLNNNQRTLLFITRGALNRRLGNYEIAKNDYQTALNKAKNSNQFINNKIIILNNLGSLFEALTEYDQSLKYFKEAKEFLEIFNPNDYQLKIKLITNVAEIMIYKNDLRRFENLINEANVLIEFVNLPQDKAQILRTIGNLKLKLNQYNSALTYFQLSTDISQKHGLLRRSIETKIDLIKCLFKMNKIAEALNEIEIVRNTALKLNNVESEIDALALLLKIKIKINDRKDVKYLGNLLINKIELLSSNFIDPSLLISYRQKIYEYLKIAVLAELSINDIESAFIKLSHAKGRNLLFNTFLESDTNQKNKINSLIKSLNDNLIVIDFMTMPDTLYAFVLDNSQLQLFKKEIKKTELRNTIFKYREYIDKTIDIYKDYNQIKNSKHYNETTKMGKLLFNTLFGWSYLSSRLEEIEKIIVIPDDNLFEIPFSTLVNDHKDSARYLAQNQAIINLPSSLFLFKKNIIQKQNTNKKILISADPAFPNVKNVISFIKKTFPQTNELSISNYPFNKQEVLNKLNGNFDIFIIIGHGLANSTNPDLSYIELFINHKNQKYSKKIKIQMSDLKKINNLRIETILLIGCESAGGKLYSGAGISGLQQEFLALGTENVLASCWKIDANITMQQVIDILKFMRDNNDISLALKNVEKLSIQKLKKDRYYQNPHPYFWGSFKLLKRTI